MAKVKYRLGLDLGTNSLGWCVYGLDADDTPERIIRMGSRIFSDGRDPKSLASLAATRRQARQARRRRDRVLKRRQRLMQALIEAGLMPAEAPARQALQQLDPFVLRARGLDDALAPHEFGRALYHLCRKRGFKSSRKDRGDLGKAGDKEKEKESGKVSAAVKALRERIEATGCRTVGEYLAREHAQRQPVRARRNMAGEYVLYLQRAMVESEFDRLWDAQAPHHPWLLTTELRDHLKDILLFQRRLKAPLPGRCLFEEGDYRHPLCSPLQQRFRILQELNNLRVKEGIGYRPLNLDERNRMLAALLRETGQATFSRLAKIAGLGKATAFNLESEKRRGLKGDVTSARFSATEALGDAWWALPEDTQDALAVLVERADQDDALVKALLALPGNIEPAKDIIQPQPFEMQWIEALTHAPAMDASQAHEIASIQLPEGYGSLGRSALHRIIPELENEVITYDIAVQRADYTHHSQLHTGEFYQRLPYYGQLLRGYTTPMPTASNPDEQQYGRIPNPTVHIGLNQLRQLMNALIRRYGHPHEVVVELARDFGLSGERRREMEREQTANQKRNEALDNRLITLGMPPSRENRLRLRLWDELGEESALDRECIYSGQRFGMAMLFGDEVEIDHILPFSKSLHDGNGNKVLCLRRANRDKGDRTPFDAFGHSPPGYAWPEIQARVERLFAASRDPGVRRKAEHFRENALQTFLGDRDFLARHLSDTAYLSRAARHYLSYACHKDRVWVSTGKLTGLLRAKWGLNRLLWGDGEKNRNDHRHHALDAAVVGQCSRSLIQKIATAAARAEARGAHRLLEELPLPWPAFRDELRNTLLKIVVSHKPDTGVTGKFNKDGNYGWRPDPSVEDGDLYVQFERIEGLRYANVAHPSGKPGQPSPKVTDPALREAFAQLLFGLSEKDQAAALARFSAETGIKRVRLQRRRSEMIAINLPNRSGKSRYVESAENYCRDIVLNPKGRWTSQIVTFYQANRPAFDPNRLVSSDRRPVLMRIRKGDMILIEIDGSPKVMRVSSFTNEGVCLADHHEANTAERDGKPGSGFSYTRMLPEPLRKAKARLVGVDILGYVNDPGFRE